MESFSRPFQSRKLSNVTTKHPYAGVFSGHRHNYAGAKPIDVDDYREIFGNPEAAASSSIPVLDLSTLAEHSDAFNVNMRTSKPDYSNIFGFRQDVAVSYEQLFDSDKFRPPSSKTTTSHDSFDLARQSSDGFKQFKMSYNKITQKSKQELDETKHVTQLHAVPGFTRFIDERAPPKMKPEKQKPSPVHVNLDSNSSASFDEELDVNSAAFALRKAIEKAQESIRIAKESVSRKKKNLGNFSNKNSKDILKVKDRTEDGEKLSVAKKVIDEINGKFSELNKFKENDTIVSNSARVMGETESKTFDLAGKYQYATSDFDADHTEKTRTEKMEFVDDYEVKIEVIKTSAGELDHQNVGGKVESVDMIRESNENKDNDRLQLLENEKKEEVLEKKNVENSENSENHKGIEEVSNWSESENESEDDHVAEIHEDETNEMFNDVCEREMKASVQTFDSRIEESKTTLKADCEMKREDNRTGERNLERLGNTFVQEFEKKPSCVENFMEEIDTLGHIHESCKVDMNDDNVEKTREIDDVTEAMDGAEALEDVFCETDNEDEYDVKLEENDVRSESSSGTIDGVKIENDESNKEEDIIDNFPDLGSENDVQSESSSSSLKTVEEESNTQLPHKEIPDTIKDSREPQYRDLEDEIAEPEPGPSKVWGKEHSRRIDEATAREREHEKNRLAVNRAIREARERAFVEARERAERDRAAVEKATEEVRQKMMAEAREKVAKASVAAKSSAERTSAQSKLRAERAAVERATSEARQRALEKAMSQKSVSDLNSSESALRSKAKLEKHNRIMERAAKALAEKEKRDLLAQKEQAERNRFAENLDANIERWSNGKEGNLRALLSTLQYILGPESGWQAVTLTDIITSSAVKKAYRKATLCVHPDKLQQRGATIQHKYICEKVFDLLKAAWNRFNAKER